MAQIHKLIQENQKLKYQLEKFKSSNGLLPYIDDSAIKGGYHVVKNISERDSIDCCHRKLGMKVLVIGSDLSFKEYILKTDNCKENIWKEVDVTIEENEVFLIEDYSELSENLTTQKELNLILKQLILNLQTALDEKQDILTENNVGQFMELELSTKSTPTSGDTVLGKDSLTGKAVEIPTSSLVEIVDVSNLVPYTGANKDVNIASNYFKTSKGFDFTFDENNYFRTYYSNSYNHLVFYSEDSSNDNFGYMFIEANPEIGFVVNIANGDGIYNSFHATESRTYSEKPFVSSEGFIKTGGTTNQSLTADGGVFDLNTKADLVGGNLFKGDQVLQNSKLISNNYGTYSRFTLNRASNSITTPTIPSSGTRLGEINFGSYNGTTFANVSQIASFVDATSGVGDLPSKLVFYTTPDNSSTLTERMSINNLGRIRIGSTMNYSDALNIESGHIAFQNGFGIRSYNTAGSIYAILYTSNDKVIIKSLGDGVQIKNRANTESLINITDGGNVSLGVVNPTEKLEVNGGVRALAFSTPDGTANQALTADGGVFDLSTISTTIEVTKTELDNLISSSQLIKGSLYKITGVNPDLYGGTTIFLTAIENNKLSIGGYGMFYNPKYDKSIDGFGIVRDYVFWKPVEEQTESGLYNIGDRVIWGGKHWNCISPTLVDTKYIISKFKLDTVYFEEIPFNETDYNVVYDEIKYDYEHDLIIERNEQNSNIVSFSYDSLINLVQDRIGGDLVEYNPIKNFQWGNVFDYNFFKGIGSNKIKDSLNENINFSGGYQNSLTFINNSYQNNLTFSGSSYQYNLTFNNSYQGNLTFINNSHQYNLTFINNSSQYNLTFNNSYQNNLTFNNSGQGNLNFNGSGQFNLTFINNSSQYNLTFTNSGQSNLTFDNTKQSIKLTGNQFFTGKTTNDFAQIGDIPQIGGIQGTTNYLPKFTGSGTLGNSQIFDNGTNVGIGTTSPQAKLDIKAQGALSTDIAFRVRNSTDTQNFLVVNGAGDVYNRGAKGVSSNTFFGENVGRNTTGYGNNAFGYNVLYLNTTGSYNSAFGTQAFYSNTTGNYNNAFGNNALYSNTTGYLNNAFGNNALYSNTTGANNSTFGIDTLRLNTTGNYNNAFGNNALSSNTTGTNNSAFGVNAGRYTSSGSNNEISNNSVYLGNDTRANANNETNQIVIGYNTIGNGSNSVTLGNDSITKTILKGQVIMGAFTSAPTGIEGAIYYNSTDKKHYGFNGTTWNALY